jgi:hypothetical protein
MFTKCCSPNAKKVVCCCLSSITSDNK